MTAATPTDLDNLRLDAASVAAVVNGEINQTVTTRTGKVLQTLSTISAAALPGAALGAVSAAQSEALTANTYNNGAAGVGATITANANGALGSAKLDGVSPQVGMAILLTMEGLKNGRYLITAIGDGSNPYVLTRAADANTAQKLGRATIFVAGGSLYADTTWQVQQAYTEITVGTTALTINQASGANSVAAETVRATAAEGAIATNLTNEINARTAITDVLTTWFKDTMAMGLFLRDDNNKLWLAVEPEIIKHKWLDALSVLAEKSRSAGEAITETMLPGVHFSSKSDGKLYCSITPEAIKHYQIDLIEARIGTLEGEVGGGGSGAVSADPRWADVLLDMEAIGFPVNGQSHERGTQGVPPVHTTAHPMDKMFVGGRRPDDASNDQTGDVTASDFASIVDGIESIRPSNSSLGETPVAAAIRMYAQLMQSEEGISLSDINQEFLGSSPGLGGTQISELLDNTGAPWKRLIETTSSGYSLYSTASKSFAVGCMPYGQGEGDYQANTAAGVWTTRLATLVANFRAHNASVLGFDRRLPVILKQTALHLYFSRATPWIAMEQLALANDPDSLYALSTPVYPLEHDPTDHVHLTANGYTHYGAYIGYVMYWWLRRGIKIMPFVPTVQRSGKSLFLRFPVASGKKLVLDSRWTGLSNYGLNIYESGGDEITIDDFDLLNGGLGGVCVVRAASTLAAGTKLRFGWFGSASVGDNKRGLTGFRDNTGDSVSYMLNPLHRWAPISEIISD